VFVFVHAYATDTPDMYAHAERCAHAHESARTHGRQTLMRACVLTVHAVHAPRAPMQVSTHARMNARIQAQHLLGRRKNWTQRVFSHFLLCFPLSYSDLCVCVLCVVCVLRVCVDVYLAHSHVALRFPFCTPASMPRTHSSNSVCALASCVFFALSTHMGYSVLSDPA
jgi:hypothetical protein